MKETSNFMGKQLDTFGSECEMKTQLSFYTHAAPNVTVLEHGYNMDLGFFILWENKIK